MSGNVLPNVFRVIQENSNAFTNPDFMGGQFFSRLRYCLGFLNPLHIKDKIQKAEYLSFFFGKDDFCYIKHKFFSL